METFGHETCVFVNPLPCTHWSPQTTVVGEVLKIFSDGEEQRTTTNRGFWPMTTYRRFCCNDLLRLGSLNLKFDAIQSIRLYMNHLAMWPGNCHVAHVPGGRIAGYIFAQVAGKDWYCTGKLSALVLASMDMLDLGKKLSKLLEDCCEKIKVLNPWGLLRLNVGYNACSMQIIISAHYFPAIDTMNKLAKGFTHALRASTARPRLVEDANQGT